MHDRVLSEVKLDKATGLGEIAFDLTVRLRCCVPKLEAVAFERQMEIKVGHKAHIEPFHIVNLDFVKINIPFFDHA